MATINTPHRYTDEVLEFNDLLRACARATSPIIFKHNLTTLAKFLARHIDDAEQFFFKTNNSNIFDYVLGLPRRLGNNTPEGVQRGVRLFHVLTDYAHLAIERGTLTPDMYATQLSITGLIRDGHNNLLTSAIRINDPEKVQQIFEEAKKYAPNHYKTMLTTRGYNNYNLLHEAVFTGNREIVKYVFNEARTQLTKKQYSKMLLQSSDSGNNLLHMLTENSEGICPDPFLINGVLEEYLRVFGKTGSQEVISHLLEQRNIMEKPGDGFTAINDLKPEWIKRLFDENFHYGDRPPMPDGKDEYLYVNKMERLPPATRFR